MTKEERMKMIPVWEKAMLTMEEASPYTGIGIHNLKKIAEEEDGLALWVGNKRLYKRKKLENAWKKAGAYRKRGPGEIPGCFMCRTP